MTGPDHASSPDLLALPPGRHYGGAADGSCWVMVGRALRDVETWEIVPPAASLTLAWGTGGCSVAFGDAAFDVRPGQAMWIDAGLAHRGRNAPGSDFATLFVAEPAVRAACLHVAPIGAGVLDMPAALREPFMKLTASLVADGDRAGLRGPVTAALLDWVGTTFAPAVPMNRPADALDAAAQAMRADPAGRMPLSELARAVGPTPTQLSRGFAARWTLTPQADPAPDGWRRLCRHALHVGR